MKIMVIAPHNDDEILGVAGTMAKYAKQGHDVVVCEVTAGDLQDPLVQQQKREAIKSHDLLGVKETVFMDLPVVGLKEMPTAELNSAFLKTITEIDPEIVFIPHKGDMHIDHRMVIEAAMVALRPVSCPGLKAIYAYETLSETEWNIPSVDNAFIPNAYSDISDYMDLKLESMKCHESQLCDYPHPRSLEAIEALARHRGSTVCCRYAEAFMTIREMI
jgi:LmbE family N-acetylglucosaminyl deacetylase